MIKMVKLFSLCVMFLFSSVFAVGEASLVGLEKYRLYVTKVDPEFHCFALSNNLVCQTLKKNWETETLPEVGAQVYITNCVSMIDNRVSDKDVAEFEIGYTENPEKKLIGVRIFQDSKQYGLSIISTESVCTAPDGWIFSAEYKDVILLSDGSQWMKEKAGKTVFCSESRVVVSRQKEGGYSILDLDQSSYSCKCNRKNRPGKMIVGHRSERVNPYFPEMANKK